MGLDKIEAFIQYGASPRAGISMAQSAKALAFINQRGYVIPEDIRNVCHDTMRHRLGLTYEAAAENIKPEQIIDEVLDVVPVP